MPHGHPPPSPIGQLPACPIGHAPPSIIGQFISPIMGLPDPCIIGKSPPSGPSGRAPEPCMAPVMPLRELIDDELIPLACEAPHDQVQTDAMMRRNRGSDGWRCMGSTSATTGPDLGCDDSRSRGRRGRRHGRDTDLERIRSRMVNTNAPAATNSRCPCHRGSATTRPTRLPRSAPNVATTTRSNRIFGRGHRYTATPVRKNTIPIEANNVGTNVGTSKVSLCDRHATEPVALSVSGDIHAHNRKTGMLLTAPPEHRPR